MSVAILTANLGNFDTPVDPVKQDVVSRFHRWTDDNFPPITGLTPRLQYRIPKYFGWQMFSGYDYYIWLDGTMSFDDPASVAWYLEQLDEKDIGLFKHPDRHSIRQEVEHIEEHLQKGKPYITSRYKNGLHQEQLAVIEKDKTYRDDRLFASTAFIYRNNARIQSMMQDWWFYQSRYFTCDQVVLPWLLDAWGVKYKVLEEELYKTKHLVRVSTHK
jgi:hypothetical protein